MAGNDRRYGKYDELKIGLAFVIAACTRIAATSALRGIVDVDADAAFVVDHLHAIEFAAIVLETLGTEYLATGLALDPAHRIGQFRSSAGAIVLTPSMVLTGLIVILRRQRRARLGRCKPGRTSGEDDQHGQQQRTA